MKSPRIVLSTLALLVAAIYLFVSAPPALPETDVELAGSIPIEKVLATIAAENDVVRTLYTREIVTAGTAAGLLYDEEWRRDEVQAGPLPALFLREAAQSLQSRAVPLGLFLGSDFPISPSNKFVGAQADVFERIKRTGEPEFFYASDTGQYTAMFPDYAGVEGCVTCHNEHAESPKTDWVIDDVMGATTWSYEKASVSPAEYLRIIGAVRESFRDAYGGYLAKVESFDSRPVVGDGWPADGFFLPSVEVFMEEFERRASARTVHQLLSNAAQPPAPPTE